MRTRTTWLALLAAVVGLWHADDSWARNYHVSGGIQYVAQGDKEKAKGLYEDAQRLYGKAVVQLTEGIAEDPNDLEAYDYLARAYAELDSTERAGWAFRTGIASACADEKEKKLCKRMQDNQKFYWGQYYQSAFDTFKLADVAPTPEAGKDSILAAAAKMWKAIDIYDQDGSSYCNLAAFYAKAEDMSRAMEVVKQGLTKVPGDSCLTQRQADLTIANAETAAGSGEFDAAIATYEKVLAADPSDAATASRLGELYFQKGQKLSEGGDAAGAKAAFAAAATNFGTFYKTTNDDENARYNYALSLVQAEQYEEAAGLIHKGLMAKPKSQDLHNLMARVYTGLQLPEDATKHRLINTMLDGGQPAAEPATAASASAEKWGATKDAAKLLQSLGPPEEVLTQTLGEYEAELWCWWTKSRAVTLVKGQTVSDLDFSRVMTAKAN